MSAELVERLPEVVDLSPLEEALASAERRFAHVQTPEGMDALGDSWAATAKQFREERDRAARELGEARAKAGGAFGGGRVFRLGHIWDDLTPDQQRSALQHTFERVVVAKVPPRSEPDIEFVVRDAHPWRLELDPPDVVPVNSKR